LYAVPAARELPDVISENLSVDAGSLTPAVTCALTCFFHDVIGLPQERMVGFPRLATNYDFSQVRVSRLQIFLDVPASELLSPQIVPTAAHTG